MKALLVVDVQNDFCPGGALPAPEGDQVVEPINKLMQKFNLVVASKDWHPKETPHFDKWPVHCIQDTEGAKFHPDLNVEGIKQIFLKGTGHTDGYSAFDATNKNLKAFLQEQGVDELYVTGLTTEYCVKNSAIDAAKNGFTTYLVKDAIEGVKANADDPEKAIEEMEEAGVKVITSKEIN